jgi:hypothetical protein
MKTRMRATIVCEDDAVFTVNQLGNGWFNILIRNGDDITIADLDMSGSVAKRFLEAIGRKVEA